MLCIQFTCVWNVHESLHLVSSTKTENINSQLVHLMAFDWCCLISNKIINSEQHSLRKTWPVRILSDVVMFSRRKNPIKPSTVYKDFLIAVKKYPCRTSKNETFMSRLSSHTFHWNVIVKYDVVYSLSWACIAKQLVWVSKQARLSLSLTYSLAGCKCIQ